MNKLKTWFVMNCKIELYQVVCDVDLCLFMSIMVYRTYHVMWKLVSKTYDVVYEFGNEIIICKFGDIMIYTSFRLSHIIYA